MDSEEIREFIALISKSNFDSFELERGDFKLKLVKERPAVQTVVAAAPAEVAAVAPTVVASAPAETAAPASSIPDDCVEIESPIVGTFYASASPDTPPFVEIGTRVSKGQVLCIVEAMKVMNEIESEHDGEIVEVLVKNAQPVEYGEPIFRIRPA